MPQKTSVLDRYRQRAILTAQLSYAAGAADYSIAQLVTGLTNLQKLAWEVTEIRYYLSPAAAILAVTDEANDQLFIGITASGLDTQGFAPNNPAMYDQHQIRAVASAVAAYPHESTMQFPIIHKFEEPLLVIPQGLYLLVETYNTTGAGNGAAWAEILYKEIELGPEDWYDLLQLRMPLGAV